MSRNCEVCGAELPENAAPNRRLCADCAYKAYRERANLYQRERYQKIRDRITKEAKEEREYWKSKGYCTQCHKEKAAPGHVTCQKCLDYMREYKRKKREEKKKP